MPEPVLAPDTERLGTRPMPPLVSGALPLVGHALQFLADTRGLLERGYAEHGEVFRLRLRPGRPAVIMLGPEWAKWVFKKTDDHSLAIGPSLDFTLWLLGTDFYFLAEPVEYQHQRETLLPLFRNHIAAGHLASYLHGFGGGTHRCLGEHFATLLTHVVVTRLFQRYELTLVDPDPVPVRTPAFKGPRSPCRIGYRAQLQIRNGHHR